METVRWLFGQSLTPREQMRKNRRTIDAAIRGLDTIIKKQNNTAKQLERQIKTYLQQGQTQAAKVEAKNLIRTRASVIRYLDQRASLNAFQSQLVTAEATQTMAQGMKDAARIMRVVNRTANVPGLQKLAMDFEKENDIMEQRQEVMDEAMDDVFEGGEEEEDEVIDKVLEEIGVEKKYSMGATPQGLQGAAIAEGRVAQAVGGEADPGDDDLQARLNGLRR